MAFLLVSAYFLLTHTQGAPAENGALLETLKSQATEYVLNVEFSHLFHEFEDIKMTTSLKFTLSELNAEVPLDKSYTSSKIRLSF
ncbi:uncharacterized protein LOC116231746 isoform X2 [Phasianus colchicus]|uniref:uncharacterized protein LOC116231746 isoform X2 n=1 Tax=Phasianus colchicus TaxID=9054 RepID=UPI00129D8BC6|nr:uncharacterized protein LOC116231746 isoform X2 [Phasianus colchicus]